MRLGIRMCEKHPEWDGRPLYNGHPIPSVMARSKWEDERIRKRMIKEGWEYFPETDTYWKFGSTRYSAQQVHEFYGRGETLERLGFLAI